MLRWNKRLYIGANVKEPEKIKEKINQNKFVPGIFLITLSSNPDNLLEIISALMLKQDTLRSLCPEIIGIAHGKEEAMKLVESILNQVYQETGTFQVQNYLKNR